MLTSILYSLSSLHQSMKGDIRKNKRYSGFFISDQNPARHSPNQERSLEPTAPPLSLPNPPPREGYLTPAGMTAKEW